MIPDPSVCHPLLQGKVPFQLQSTNLDFNRLNNRAVSVVKDPYPDADGIQRQRIVAKVANAGVFGPGRHGDAGADRALRVTESPLPTLYAFAGRRSS